ncbi:MAG TPA: MFS transporter [Candidatus Dormibacteraeota bacterium]|nr:MFS transporter [Candidatus Dormibacteraeota bacterium]
MVRKRWLRIIPVAIVMYTIAFISRTNIGMGLPAISRDLHLNPTQAGAVAGIFFWGYLLLQIPGGHLAEHWSAKKFIAILMVIWGGFAIGCGLVHTYRQLWIMRLLLGVAEGGVYPASLILLSHWFPRGERARANAFWNLCLPLAVIISSPLSGWLLDRWNWRIMLIAAGAMPFLWIVVWLIFISDHPREAKWISDEEREFLETTLERESIESGPSESKLGVRALLRPQILVLMIIYFCFICGQMGFLFWLPTAMGQAKKMSNLVIGILFAVPFVWAAISMVFISHHSDKTRERPGHVAFALGVAGIFLLIGVLLSHSCPAIAFIFVSLAAMGSYAPLGPFWAIPTETLPRNVAGASMGLINGFGNLGGYFSPLLLGYIDKTTGSFALAFGVLAVIMLIGAGMCFLITPASREAVAEAVPRS